MHPQDAVGCAVEVYLEAKQAWAKGIIEEYDEEVGFRVVYEDGDDQWEDPRNTQRVHVLVNESTVSKISKEIIDPPDEEEPSHHVANVVDIGIDDVKVANTSKSHQDLAPNNPTTPISMKGNDQLELKQPKCDTAGLESSELTTNTQYPQVRSHDSRFPWIEGRIDYFRCESEIPRNVFVKVSLVAPGPGSVATRSSILLHTTSTQLNSSRPSWTDVVWSYDFSSSSIDGEILYTVYHEENHVEFLGQALFPLKINHVDEECSLTSRQGKLQCGMYLKLYFIFHSIKKNSIIEINENKIELKKNKKEIKLIKKSTFEINRNKNEEKIKNENLILEKRLIKIKQNYFNKPNYMNIIPSSKINRNKFIQKIKNENIIISKRTIQTQQKKKQIKQQIKQQKNNLMDKNSKNHIKLIEIVADLEKNVSELQNQLFDIKAMHTRLVISNGRSKTTIASLERTIEKSNPSKNSDKSTKQPWMDVNTNTDGSERQRILQQEQQDLLKERKSAVEAIKILVLEENEMKMKMIQMKNNIQRTKRIEQMKLSKEDLQFKNAITTLTNLKIKKETNQKRENVEKKQKKQDHHMKQLESKLEIRQKKEKNLFEEIRLVQDEYNQLVQSNAVEILRQKVLDMQYLVLFCENEHKANTINE